MRSPNPKTIETDTTPAEHRVGNNYAITHGGTAQKLILPGEDPAEFASLLADLQADYQPETVQQNSFVEQLATAHWFLWRRQRACNAIEAKIYAEVEGAPEELTDAALHRLTLADRYKTTAERALKRAFQNAESFRKDRQGAADRLARQTRWQAEQEIRERRCKLQEQKAGAREQPARKPQQQTEPAVKPFQWPHSFGGSEASAKNGLKIATPNLPGTHQE